MLPTDQLCTTVPLIADEQETTPIFHAGIPEFNTGRVCGSELGKNRGMLSELIQVLELRLYSKRW